MGVADQNLNIGNLNSCKQCKLLSKTPLDSDDSETVYFEDFLEISTEKSPRSREIASEIEQRGQGEWQQSRQVWHGAQSQS